MILEIAAAATPTALILGIFKWVIGKKVDKGEFNQMQKALSESLKEVKESNGKVHDQVVEQGTKIAELGRDIAWIRRAIEKNNK